MSITALTQREKPMAGARWDDARPGTGPSPTPAPVASSGRPVAQVAIDLAISEQTIYVWRRQHLIDTEQLPGTTSSENAELVAARRRIAELEAEVASHRRAAQLLGEVVSPKDGSRRSP
jgi:transposase-like protein